MSRIFLGVAAGLALAFAASAGAAQNYVMKVSSPTANDSNQHWMELFETMVEERSGGRIAVELYPANQLGQIPATVEGVAFGTIEMSMPATGFFIGLDPRFEVFDAPGLFTDVEHAQRSLADPELLERISHYGEASGVRPISAYVSAPLGMLTRRPVEKMADLDGVKLRVAGGSALQSQPFQTFGAAPVSMPLGETLPALQTGTIDGLLAGSPVFPLFQFNDIAQDLVILPETYLMVAMVANSAFLDGLGPELEGIVMDAAAEATAETDNWNRAEIDRLLDAWTASGGRIVSLSDPEAYLGAVQAATPAAVAANPALEAELDVFRAIAERHAAK